MRNWDEVTTELNRLQGMAMNIAGHRRKKADQRGPAFEKVTALLEIVRAEMSLELYEHTPKHQSAPRAVNE